MDKEKKHEQRSTIQFRTPEQLETMRQIKSRAALDGVKFNQFVYNILKNWLSKQVD